MASPKIANHINRLWQRGVDGAHRLDERSHGRLGLWAGAASQVVKLKSTITAAAIAYFAIFSLFPILLLAAAIASFSLGPLIDPHIIIQRLEFLAPALGQLVGENIDEIILARGSVTIIALVGLVFAASNFFFMLTEILNEIWAYKKSRAIWKRQGWAILFVLLLVGPILFLASFVGSMITSFVTGLPAPLMPIVDGIGLVLAFLLDVAFFMTIYLMLPHAKAGWRDILPGAFGAGLLWEIAKKAFLLFMSTFISTSNLVYGSVTAIIAILTWAYLSGLIFLFGAYLSVAYFQLKEKSLVAVSQPITPE